MRITAPVWNSALLVNHTPFGLFFFCFVFYLAAFVLAILCKDHLMPHYSYLIAKQQEMVTRGLSNKDMRLLDT